LSDWAKQGILLLNSTLTVRKNEPNSHQNCGWQKFTDEIIQQISREKSFVIFVLWGKFANQKIALIDEEKHCILTASHPSPFSAYRGFFGCRHFSKINEILTKKGGEIINW
jgi:uracil-DNA glycosylase